MASREVSNDIDKRLEEVIRLLKSKGFKITAQRVAIINAILKLHGKHPTLTEIHREAAKMAPMISFSTVYTTAKMLEELGLVKLFSHKGDTVVETDTNRHVNVILGDGRIIDLHDPELVKYLREKLAQHGIKSDNFIVNVIVNAKSSQ
ncbi:Fur family transcriptional regulator [Stetteria hydrogenophila]